MLNDAQLPTKLRTSNQSLIHPFIHSFISSWNTSSTSSSSPSYSAAQVKQQQPPSIHPSHQSINQSTDKHNPALIITRSRWLPLLPVPDYLYHRLPSTFSGDVEAGLTSSHFDVTANIADGDPRAGLNNAAKREVQRIMKSHKVDFDEARRIYIGQRFSKNNIGPDGRPRDPKFVSFS